MPRKFESGRVADQRVETDTILLAILAVLVDEREARAVDHPGQTKTEVLLSDAGLGAPTIAQLLNKQPAAVRMAISRARPRKQIPARDRVPGGSEEVGNARDS